MAICPQQLYLKTYLDRHIIIAVNPDIVKQLVALNRQFYSQFANPFSATRPSGQARLDRIVQYVGESKSALDIGCGNGRLAERLDREGRRLNYAGIDASRELIEIAVARRSRFVNVSAEFRVAELTEPNWDRNLPFAPFDIAVALAVLHHIPSFALRRDVLKGIHSLLAPGGTCVLTNWQFAQNERMRKKMVGWETAGIDEKQVEQGDALLYWKHGGTGYRYCHFLTKDEVKDLAAQSGFRVVRQFYADATLNLYSILQEQTLQGSNQRA